MTWIALSKKEHLDKAISANRNYLFAKKIILSPVASFEISQAVSAVPLVFAPLDENYQLCSVLGMEQGKNLMIDQEGRWGAKFIPAILQAHPFAIGQLENGGNTILFKKDNDFIVNRGEGDPLFNEDGSEGHILKKYVQLLTNIRKSESYLQRACVLIRDLELLQPCPIKVQKADGAFLNLQGLSTIDVNKLRELEEEKFLKLREYGALELIYAHLYSMGCFNHLTAIMNLKERDAGDLKQLGEEIFATEDYGLNFDFT